MHFVLETDTEILKCILMSMLASNLNVDARRVNAVANVIISNLQTQSNQNSFFFYFCNVESEKKIYCILIQVLTLISIG